MKTKTKEKEATNEKAFELKYCERCGALWLRPSGGEQIYCVRCSREMDELPPSYSESQVAGMLPGPEWSGEENHDEDVIDEDTSEVRHEWIC